MSSRLHLLFQNQLEKVRKERIVVEKMIADELETFKRNEGNLESNTGYNYYRNEVSEIVKRKKSAKEDNERRYRLKKEKIEAEIKKLQAQLDAEEEAYRSKDGGVDDKQNRLLEMYLEKIAEYEAKTEPTTKVYQKNKSRLERLEEEEADLDIKAKTAFDDEFERKRKSALEEARRAKREAEVLEMADKAQARADFLARQQAEDERQRQRDIARGYIADDNGEYRVQPDNNPEALRQIKFLAELANT